MTTLVALPKTAIFVQGMHLRIPRWEDLVWGKPEQQQLGLVPTAILLFAEYNATTIIFGSGNPPVDDKFSSAAAAELADSRWDDLKEFCPLQRTDLDELRKRIRKRHVLDVETTSTYQQLRYAADHCMAREIERLIIVSSPNHSPSLLLEAFNAFDQDKYRKTIYANLLLKPSMVKAQIHPPSRTEN